MKSEKIISEVKKQIWDNAYHVKEHHWTQMYYNLDLLEKDIKELMDYIKDLKEENKKQKEILDILKKELTPLIWKEGTYFILDGIEKGKKTYEIFEEWLNEEE